MIRTTAIVCCLGMTAFPAAVVPIAAAPSPAPLDPRLEFPFLASLEIPADQLPRGCALREVSEADRKEIGLPNFRNGAIRTDSASFLIGDERFKKLLRRAEIAAIYFACYREKDDLGIFGWSFHSSTAARESLTRLQQSYANEPSRFRFWIAGRNVVLLWRDPSATDASFDALAKQVEKRVDAASTR